MSHNCHHFYGIIINIIIFFVLIIVVDAKFPLFTQEKFRASYTPHTTPEESFDEWDDKDVPNPAFLVNETESLQKHLAVKSFLSENWKSSVATVIRCPIGWTPIGPFCMTVSAVQPYTQCPMDLKRFEIGPGNPVIPMSGFPGLCLRHEFTGLTFQCPPGFNLVRKSETNATTTRITTEKDDVCENDKQSCSSSYICEMNKRITYAVLDSKQKCSDGFTDQLDGYCGAIERVPPEPACPTEYSLDSHVIDAYSLYSRQRLECATATKIKGKLWCPEGYSLAGEFFPSAVFGEVLNSYNETESSLPPFELSREAKGFLSNDWLYKEKFRALDSPFCFKVLAVLCGSCNRLECSSPNLRHLRRVLINWGYKLQVDPDLVVYSGIPSGRDFRFTNSGTKLTI